MRPLEFTDLSIVDAIPAHIWRAAPDGAIQFVNQQWIDYTGLSQAESQGWAWASTNVIHPDDLPDLLNTWRRVLAAGQPDEAEARVRRSDGEYRWYLIRAVPARDQSGAIVGWYGTNTDIEDRKRSETQYRQIIDAIPQLIAALSPTGKVLYANKSVLEYSGLSERDLAEENFLESSRVCLGARDDVPVCVVNAGWGLGWTWADFPNNSGLDGPAEDPLVIKTATKPPPEFGRYDHYVDNRERLVSSHQDPV